MPVPRQSDPAEVIEINARPFKVTEVFFEKIIRNLLTDQYLKLTAQDRELINEAPSICDQNKPQVKESTMRIASFLICDIIEKQNSFKDQIAEEGKKGVLVFLPGLHEIFEFIDFINEWYDPIWIKNHLEIIPLHSSLGE